MAQNEQTEYGNKTFEIQKAADGQTLERVVREAYDNIPWSKAREWCKEGRVRLDGAAVHDGAKRVAAGNTVTVSPRGKKQRAGTLSDEAIAYVDRDVVVVRKPAGMMSCPFEQGDKDTLVDQTRAALRTRSTGGRQFDPMLGVVHRLDKDTTGLLVFARTLDAKKHLEQQFRVHSVHRRYVAIAHGEVHDGTAHSFFVQDRGDGLRGSWGAWRSTRLPPPHDAQESVTHVRHLEELAGSSLVECALETGRQHQIRIHLSEAGHPIVGERVYIRDYNETLIEAPRPMLHARELGFVHPRTNEDVFLEQPIPADFEATLNRLRRAKR